MHRYSKLIQCDLCFVIVDTYDRLEAHNRHIHTKHIRRKKRILHLLSRTLTCTSCDFTTRSVYILGTHVRRVHDLVDQQCVYPGCSWVWQKHQTVSALHQHIGKFHKKNVDEPEAEHAQDASGIDDEEIARTNEDLSEDAPDLQEEVASRFDQYENIEGTITSFRISKFS